MTHAPALYPHARALYHQTYSCHHLNRMLRCLFAQIPHQTWVVHLYPIAMWKGTTLAVFMGTRTTCLFTVMIPALQTANILALARLQTNQVACQPTYSLHNLQLSQTMTVPMSETTWSVREMWSNTNIRLAVALLREIRLSLFTKQGTRHSLYWRMELSSGQRNILCEKWRCFAEPLSIWYPILLLNGSLLKHVCFNMGR